MDLGLFSRRESESVRAFRRHGPRAITDLSRIYPTQKSRDNRLEEASWKFETKCDALMRHLYALSRNTSAKATSINESLMRTWDKRMQSMRNLLLHANDKMLFAIVFTR